MAVVILFAAGAAAQTPSSTSPADLKTLSLEQLTRIEVTSAGRKEQKLLDLAGALTVITRDDIRRTGARSIPEALQLAPGLEVARMNSGSWAISARGFNTTAANKLQVFIDGRSVYSPLFGGVFWDMQTVVMEDIDRIEVIRGPGAALWGGNAVECVINVITVPGRETQGVMAVAGGGLGERGISTVQYGGRAGRHTTYRVFGNFTNRGAFDLTNGTAAKDPYQIALGGFRMDSTITPADQVTVQGDLYSGASGILNRPDIGLHGADLTATWSHRFGNGSDLQLLTYYDRTSRLVPQQVGEARNTYDIALQHHFRAGERHDIVWGIGYRDSTDRTKPTTALFFEPSGRQLGLFNIFAQDEIAIVPEKLHLILGSKFENYTLSGWNAQPTARLAWTRSTRQTVWGAVSRAVRIPTQFDQDLRVTANTPFLLIRGDPAFRPEGLLAYEIGYRMIPTQRFSLSIATYYNVYNDLRSQESPPQGFPVVLANRLQGRTYGAEITARYQLLPWWRVTSWYSNLQKQLELEPGSTDRTGGLQEGSDPRNQLFFRSSMDLPRRTELDLVVRHVSALEVPAPPPVPAYTVFDLRAGWRPVESFELSVTGRNLNRKHHLEFGPFGELVGRPLYVTGIWRL